MFGICADKHQSSLKHDWLGLPVVESCPVPIFALAGPAMHPAGTAKHWTHLQSSKFLCI